MTATAGSDPLARLAEFVRARGELPEGSVRARPRAGARPAGLAEAPGGGERYATAAPSYELAVEAIREGYLLHYGTGRVVSPDDPDLALLAGDRLYALGLELLAELGDLAAVATLAELIAACARAHAHAELARAQAAWREAVAAIASH